MTAPLYIVNHPDALQHCVEVAAESDAILLIGAAAAMAARVAVRPLLVLADDLPTDGRCASGIVSIDYQGFVRLVTEHQPIISWC